MRRTYLGTLLGSVLVLATACTGSSGSSDSTEFAGTTAPPASIAASDPPSSDPVATDAPTGSTNTQPPAPEPDDAAENPTFVALPEIAEGDPDLHTGVLPNGLTYYVRRNDRPGGSAELRLVVNAGSARETAEQSGVAHFLEHMLFNGTASFPKNELVDVLRHSGSQFGADINAYTAYDETVYQLTVPTRERATLTTGLDVLVEWLSAATLDPDEVVNERGVVLDEWRSRGESSDGRVDAAIDDVFLRGSSFDGRAPIGTAEAIEQMSPETLRSFYDRWYRPDNAAVVVVGDVNVDDVVAQLEARFSGLQPRGSTDPNEALSLAISSTLSANLIADPDLTYRAIELTLPATASSPTIGTAPEAIADYLIFTTIANRLSDDASRGTQTFDQAYTSDNNRVRLLDAPSVVVHPRPGEYDSAMLALLDEFERVHRFGFDDVELQRTLDNYRGNLDAGYASRDTRQDAELADRYAEAFLSTGPVLTEDSNYLLETFILDNMSRDYLEARFEFLWDHTPPYLIVYGPQSDEAELPALDDIEDAVGGLPDREIVARPSSDAVPDELLAPPAPVVEASQAPLQPQPEVFLEPIQLDFANGVTVILDATPISENEVTLLAQSNGGVANVAPEDVLDAHVAGDVVTSSGAGEFDQVQLEQILSGSTADVYPSIDDSTDSMYGTSATDDLTELLQLVHVYMTDPNFDPAALDRVLDDARNQAADPLADQETAAFAALSRHRYGDDPRFRAQLTEADIESIDLTGIERAWRQHFGNAAGWTFVIVGDIDTNAVIDLARQYLGTLPSTGPDEPPISITPDPPGGIVTEEIAAGTGDRSTLMRLYSTRTSATVKNAVLADVATEVVSNRILARIREELGASYSPTAFFNVFPSEIGGDDYLDIFVQVTADPDQLDSVSATLSAELADLTGAGPTDDEIEAALAVVEEQYNYINDDQLATALLAGHTGIGQSAAEFVESYYTLVDLDPREVKSYLADAIPLDTYIEIRAVPR